MRWKEWEPKIKWYWLVCLFWIMLLQLFNIEYEIYGVSWYLYILALYLNICQMYFVDHAATASVGPSLSDKASRGCPPLHSAGRVKLSSQAFSGVTPSLHSSSEDGRLIQVANGRTAYYSYYPSLISLYICCMMFYLLLFCFLADFLVFLCHWSIMMMYYLAYCKSLWIKSVC